MFFDPLYLIMLAPAMLLALWAQFKVKRAYARNHALRNARGLTGAQVARELLRANGIGDVLVEETKGWLSDHYDPRTRVVRLSPEVFHGASVSSMGIAAHEVGHAIQHAQAYKPLVLRTAIAPVASLGSNLAMILLMVGFLLGAMNLVYLGIVAFSAAVFFTLVTLPVEFNASARAKQQLPALGLAQGGEMVQVGQVLNAAAMTYVAAAVSAIVQLVYFLLRAGLLGGRDE